MIVSLTRNGIAMDIRLSPYKHKINYRKNSYIIYVFSSEFYKGKFVERLEENRQKINGSLSNRFGFEIANDILCDIKLYSMIEKRGFLIKNTKEGFECLNDIILDGKNLIAKN